MGKHFEKEYNARLISAEQAAGMVKSGDSIHFGGAANVATVIDKYLARRKAELENVTIRSYIDTARYQIFDADPEGEVFKWHSGFVLGFTGNSQKNAESVSIFPAPGTMCPHLSGAV